MQADKFDITENVLLQNRHHDLITTWKVTTTHLRDLIHITGAYCSPAVGKPLVIGLNWELQSRKPYRGVEILNNTKLANLLQNKLELSQQQLLECQLGLITVKHYIKVDNKIYAPIPADPLEKQTILEQTKEFFKILETNHIDSQNEIHITAGDMNGHTGNETESHITAQEKRQIRPRQGDPHHPANNSLPLSTSVNTTSPMRGRLLLDMINTTAQIILNGRFERKGADHIPATFSRCEKNANPPRVERTIVDYFLINKRHWSSITNCTVHEGSHMHIGYVKDDPSKTPCDHELLTLALELPGSIVPMNHYSRKRPPRKQYLASKLKDKKIKKKFEKALKQSSVKTLENMHTEKTRYEKGEITKQTLADRIQLLFTSNIQKQAQSILGEVSPVFPDPNKKPIQPRMRHLRISAKKPKYSHITSPRLFKPRKWPLICNNRR